MSNNLATVHQMFASFGQGDLPGVLACLADDVTFFNGSNPSKTPIGGSYLGADGALDYFQRLVGNQQINSLTPTNFQETPDGKILHDVREEGIVRSTGKPYALDMHFAWTFNDAGKVRDWKGTGNFSSLENAYSN